MQTAAKTVADSSLKPRIVVLTDIAPTDLEPDDMESIPILAIPDSVPGYPAPRSLPRQIAATLIGSSFAYAGRA